MRQRIAHYRTLLDLLSMLLIRDLDARYKGSLLGKLWPLVTQASQIALYTYVFGVILRVRVNIEGLPNTKLAFGIWLFAGLLPWLAFTGGLGQATTSVIGQPNLVKKVVFPLSLLPIVPVLSSLVESCFGLVPLVALFALVTHQLHPTILLLPFVWAVQILFTLGFGYIISGLTVYLRDIPQTIGIILNVWFYLTPIVYPRSAVPPALRSFVFSINPFAGFVDAYRGLILIGRFDEWHEFSMTVVFSMVVFTLGFSLYRRLTPAFADVL
ncbi:MAG: ABC transporter permease [Acidobacteriaceae bacterium]|nr:ABC transporter permease [Acidobacteriaceae bacterium]MBV9779416.1 ABC transporter permease [Acidobacteriaceae bacterium]